MVSSQATRSGSGSYQTVSALQVADFVPAQKNVGTQVLSRPSLSYWQDAWIRLKKNRQALIALCTIILVTLITLFGPYIYRVDPSDQSIGRISEPPGRARTVTVVADSTDVTETVLDGVEATPAKVVDLVLEAPQNFKVVGEPTNVAVKLSWTPVKAAAGYVIYRSKVKPSGAGDLGVPIGDITQGNQVTYTDNFELKEKHYFYSIVAKNEDESTNASTLEVSPKQAISLSDAQAINPDATEGSSISLPSRPMGTDYLGRDMVARLISGARVSLFIGFFAPFLSVIIGILIGGISGFFGGKIDSVLMRFTDFVLALPFLLFMILFKVVFGAGPGENGIMPMLVSLVVLSWTGPARLTRGQILQLRESEFVQASRLLGARPLYLIFRHLLPNTLGVILVSLTFAIPSAIFTEAFLSFIGMGVAPPTASWGSMCNDGVKTFLTTPHEFVFPSLVIAVTVLAFNVLGDGLRDALDPKMRSVE